MATYTLDFDASGILITGDNPQSKGTLPLTSIIGLSGNNYTAADVEKIKTEQREWNYLDAIKDGTKVGDLNGLNIYDTDVPFSQLHIHENKILSRKKGNLSRTTWLKTKVGSKLNLIQTQFVFWESGLGHISFIETLDENPEIVTFGSYIDPLSKPGKIWPDVDKSIKITDKFMEKFGFGKSSITATTLTNAIASATKGRSFDYRMQIACGEGCNGATPCTISFNGSKDKDDNGKYFEGNEAKNKITRGAGVLTSEKTKLVVAKGWGDKVQVMLYYMFYHLHNEQAIMTTCDFVVFCFCMTLNIPCVYTGIYDREVDVPHQERNAIIQGKSYYSILHFKPGSPIQNAINDYKYTIAQITRENDEFIRNVESLITYHNTGIDVSAANLMRFAPDFYEMLVGDMEMINDTLNSDAVKNAMNNKDRDEHVDSVVTEINNLKRDYLIIPMFRFIKSGKIKFLQTKYYTSNKAITAATSIVTNDNKDERHTFYQFAVNKRYHKTSGGETDADRMLTYERLIGTRQARSAFLKLNPAQRSAVFAKRRAEQDAIEASGLDVHDMASFPTRDLTKKIVTYLEEDINKDIVNEDADLFKQDWSKKKEKDLQLEFDRNIYIAIERLEQIENAQQRNYNRDRGGGRQNTRRRQKGGGGVDETLFETLYTLYVYRAQYDIELDRPDQSINMSVLEELYKDYPKSALNVGRRMTLKNITGEKMITYTVTGGPVNTRTQSVNMRKQAIARYAQTHKRVNTPFHINSRPMVRSHGGRITRRKKRHHRTRK
jgi:hypothetical protein